ncbi:MAG: hypothetical protein JWQ02_820 [Capsulimonas sp.]|nr:hypothetical protein [Capsulimonas sp.]
MKQRAALLRKRSEPDAAAASGAPEVWRASAGGGAPAAFGHDISRISARRPQAKMTVSQPGDVHEEEADQVADHVMRMGATDVALREELPEEEELHRSSMDSVSSPLVQRMGENDDGSADVSDIVDRGLAGGGAPLDAETRGFMEPRFGHDFSGVRIHSDAQASRSAEEVSARAYTVGSDIAFRSGEYSPGGSDGKRLLAHELTHVVQQGATSGPSLSRAPQTTASSRSVVQRDPTTPTTATPSAAPAPTDAKAVVPKASVSETVQAIVVQYQAMFDKQMEAVKQLEADFGKVDDSSMTDMAIQAGVQFAIGAALGALAERVALEAGKAAGNFILNRALKTAEPAGMISAEELAKFDTESARAQAASLATKGGAWLGGKAKESVPKVYAQISSSLKESQKFMEAHRLSLIDLKLEAQKDILLNIAPTLEAMPPAEGAVAAGRLLKGLEETYQSAVQVQYLQSVAQWGQIMSGGPGADLTAARRGVLRISYSATDPIADITITSAEITDMDKDTLSRIHDTEALKNMKLRDFPIAKVFSGSGANDSPPFIVMPSGGAPEIRTFTPWTVKRAAKYGIDTNTVDSRNVHAIVVALMMGEFGEMPLSKLGTISG